MRYLLAAALALVAASPVRADPCSEPVEKLRRDLVPVEVEAEPLRAQLAYQAQWKTGETAQTQYARATLPTLEARRTALLAQINRAEQAVEPCRRQRQAQREAEARQQAEARAAIDAAEQAKAERIAALHANPQAQRLARSAMICWYRQDRKASFDEIAKIKKYARIGGVVNLHDVADLQNDIRRDDEKLQLVLRALEAARQKPLACEKDAAVLSTCLRPLLGHYLETMPAPCNEPPYADLVEMAYEP